MAQEAKVQELLASFKQLFFQPKPDTSACKKVLSQLKIALVSFQLIPPFTGSQAEVQKQLLLARETLELATLLSVASEDEHSFERHVTQVKTYYYDYGHLLPQSERKWPLLGLLLLHLLSQNRMGEFHTELELIPLADQGNMYISFPVELEKRLMEGTYNKVLSARKDVPQESYSFFMNKLADTVREKVADCTERAYKTILMAQAPSLLMFASAQELLEYIKSADKLWTVEGDALSFNQPSTDNCDIPSHNLIRETLTYATELERII